MTCDGKGYLEIRVTVPNYSGTPGGGGTKTERKNCSNARCKNGQVNCSFCGGTGYR